MKRKRVNIWLYENSALLDLVNKLKSKRQFARAFREGLRLWADLRTGSTDVLKELFPLAVARIELAVMERKADAPPGGAGDIKGLQAEIKALRAMLEGGDGYLMQSTPPTGNLIASKPLALPVFDDDDDIPTVVITKAAMSSSASNFLAMASGLIRQ